MWPPRLHREHGSSGSTGRHWIALWTQNNVCELMDSYALPLETYLSTRPLQEWLDRHWKYAVQNERSLQSLYSQSCGDYALMYLIDRAEGRTLNEFLNRFKKHDYVNNDHKVGQMLKKLVERELDWKKVCKCNKTPAFLVAASDIYCKIVVAH